MTSDIAMKCNTLDYILRSIKARLMFLKRSSTQIVENELDSGKTIALGLKFIFEDIEVKIDEVKKVIDEVRSLQGIQSTPQELLSND